MQKEIVPSTKQPLKVLAHQKTEINVFIFDVDKNIYSIFMHILLNLLHLLHCKIRDNHKKKKCIFSLLGYNIFVTDYY